MHIVSIFTCPPFFQIIARNLLFNHSFNYRLFRVDSYILKGGIRLHNKLTLKNVKLGFDI